MPIYKCKMCEREIETEHGQNICICGYCGTSQTIPVSASDQVITALNRGNHLRQLKEFDKAAAIYEKLLEHIHSDPEIYWQLVLCRYGITYVQEPQINMMIPECHRTRYKSVFCDAAFLEAMNHSDILRRDAYRKESEYIDVMQKRLMNLAAQQDIFDIFLCSADKDSSGKASHDFIFARKIYGALTQKGYSVFFPPVTLGDTDENDMEPYIFAALNDAGVMIAAASQYENINSARIRDQWTRFANIADIDNTRKLIPAVNGIKLRNLPKRLSGLPGIEISSDKDIEKLTERIADILGNPRKQNDSDTENLSAEDLVRRGNLCLLKRKWAAAEKYFNHAVDTSPDNPSAYLGKLLVECELENEEQIPELGCDLSFSSNYHTAVRLGCTELEALSRQAQINRAAQLLDSARNIAEIISARELLTQIRGNDDTENIISECSRRIELLKEYDYQKACDILIGSLSIEETEKARDIFISLENYKDSPIKVQECTDLIIRNDYAQENTYQKGIMLLSSGEFHSDYDNAARIFASLDEYKDSQKLLKKCLRKRRLLSLTLFAKLLFIAGVCYAVPRIIDKI